jgi:hypothetical protein
MNFKIYKPSIFFSITKKIAKFLLPEKSFNKLRKISIELLWFFVYSNKEKRYINSDIYIKSLKNLSGLEIGGPSWAWMTILPIYHSIKKLDNIVTPSSEKKIISDDNEHQSRYKTGQIINVTSGWETAIEGKNRFNWFLFKKGDIYFEDATALNKIDDNKYDFVICSNVLEHIANPLKALHEFKRVIKKNGFIVILVPYYKHTFDFKRSVTTIEHIRQDYTNDIGEDDLTHLSEVIELTDESNIYQNAQPNPNFNKKEFEKYCRNNFHNRGMHHHVFDEDLLKSVAKEVNLEVIDVNNFSTSCIMLAKKL